MEEILARMRLCPVMPIITVQNIAQAVPLARALYQGGIRVLEVTLRTPYGLPAIQAITEQVPELMVGAGTLIQSDDFFRAQDAGATFGVSPGLTTALISYAQQSNLPWLPGVMSPSEVLIAKEAGLKLLKLFPAAVAGGVAMLHALSGPFQDMLFCPTGGISQKTASAFLACSNVACVGGSWLIPLNQVDNQNWSGVTEHVKLSLAQIQEGAI